MQFHPEFKSRPNQTHPLFRGFIGGSSLLSTRRKRGIGLEFKYPLGIIDSGIGGLSVVNAVRALLPAEDIIYFGKPP